jgi:hypothetical protein
LKESLECLINGNLLFHQRKLPPLRLKLYMRAFHMRLEVLKHLNDHLGYSTP